MDLKCSFPAFAMTMGVSTRDRLKLMQQMTPELVAAMGAHAPQVSISSLGVLSNFTQYESFQVLENIQCSHVFFSGLVVNICTSGASGVMTLTIEVTKNVVPNARGLAVAIRQDLESMLKNLPAPTSDSEVDDSPTAAAYRASCNAMEPLIAKNREKLNLAQKTGDGTRRMMGDTTGAYTWKSHCLVVLVTIFATLSAGPLSAYPLFNRDLARAGVFKWACADGVSQCPKQAAALRDLYATTFSMQMRFFILVGCAFDLLGAQKAAALGAVTAAVCFLLLAVAVQMDGEAWPWTQSGLMYFGLVATDLGGNLASFSILAFMWHYPKVQALFIGLSNAATQASGGLGLCIRYMVVNGYSISDSFVFLAFLSISASVVFYASCPTKTQMLTEAGRVLNTHPSSLDVSSLISVLSVRHALYECTQVFKLHFLENSCMLLYVSLFMAGELNCFSSLDTKFHMWFSSKDSEMLLQVYALMLVILGVGLNPIAGFLFDRVGFLPVFMITSFLALCVPLTLLVPVLWVQLLHVVALVTWFALFLNVASKYCVMFAPPDFFGTFLGFLTSLAGILAYVFQGIVRTPTFEGMLMACTMNMTFGWLFSVALAVILCRKGLPAKPPKDGFR